MNEVEQLEGVIDRHELRIERLEYALASLLEGLDWNYDDRAGLTMEEWDKRIADAWKVLRETGSYYGKREE